MEIITNSIEAVAGKMGVVLGLVQKPEQLGRSARKAERKAKLKAELAKKPAAAVERILGKAARADTA